MRRLATAVQALAAPAVLLLAGVVHNNAYKHASAADAGRVYLITGAAFQAALLVTIGVLATASAHIKGQRARAAGLWLVVALLVGYQLQVVGCNAWFLIDPWPLDPRAPLCSSRLHAPIGSIGLWLAAMCAQYLYLRGPGHGRQ